MNVRFVETQDLLRIGHRLALQNALARLLAGRGQLLQYPVHAPEHLLGLRLSPLGLLPVLVQHIAVTPGMIAHCADQLLHLAEGLFAVTLRVRFAAGVRHLDAQSIDAGQKTLGRFHPVFESLATNQLHRFHERACGIA